MYGTVMIGQLSGTREQVESAFSDWLTQRAPQLRGFVDAGVMIADDGVTVVNWARFADREAYWALTEDAEQDAWFRGRLAPLLAGAPRWVDGEWLGLAMP